MITAWVMRRRCGRCIDDEVEVVISSLMWTGPLSTTKGGCLVIAVDTAVVIDEVGCGCLNMDVAVVDDEVGSWPCCCRHGRGGTWPSRRGRGWGRCQRRGGTWPLVFESPVRSGYWVLSCSNCDRDRSASVMRLRKTRPDHQ